ncbi:MAG: 4-hydroxy-tetrahydrodipicolinate synthase [Nitrososphaeria archaeon]|nr:4-hydroxy-tetrahydrodipicolinate synthase [Nitrososphaeria archaeon]
MRFRARGIYPAVATPLSGREEVDVERLRAHINYLLECGVHGIVSLGCTGEAALLSREEQRRVLSISIETVDGKVPVIVGTGAVSTEQTVDLTREAKDEGATAALIITPYFMIPSPEGVFEHYKAVNDSVDLPIFLYNLPQHTTINIDPSTVARLAELENVVGIKDSSGNMGQLAQIIKSVGDKISVFTGCDDLLFPCFMMGAVGAIIALGNIAPSEAVAIYNAVQDGEIDEARRVYYQILPIARAIGAAHNFPAQVKEALEMLARPVGPTKKPIASLTAEERKEIKEALKESELL